MKISKLFDKDGNLIEQPYKPSHWNPSYQEYIDSGLELQSSPQGKMNHIYGHNRPDWGIIM